jgi:hypothetical protein
MMVHGDQECLNNINKRLKKVVHYLRVPSKEEGKGKERIPEECPELSNSDKDFVESVVVVNMIDYPSEHF